MIIILKFTVRLSLVLNLSCWSRQNPLLDFKGSFEAGPDFPAVYI